MGGRSSSSSSPYCELLGLQDILDLLKEINLLKLPDPMTRLRRLTGQPFALDWLLILAVSSIATVL